MKKNYKLLIPVWQEILLSIYREEGTYINRICYKTRLSVSVVSVATQKLIKIGVIVSKNIEGKRINNLSLTEKGRPIAEAIATANQIAERNPNRFKYNLHYE